MKMNTGLTTFRALAVLSVFFFHACVFRGGYLGVQAFFVLSGFLLTPVLVDMKSKFKGSSYFKNFYARRALRIFPVYYAYLVLVTVIALPLLDDQGVSGIDRIDRFYDQLIWALTYTYNFFQASINYTHTHLLGHFWSLAVEEQFYLLWPVVIYYLPERALKVFLLFLIVSTPFFRWAIYEMSAHRLIPGIGKEADLVVYVLPFSYFDAFATGAYFALYGKAASRQTIAVLAVFVLGAGLLGSWLHHGSAEYWSLGYRIFLRDAYQYIWAYTLLSLFFGVVLVSVREGNFAVAVFNNAILHYIGKISYGIYIFHYPIIWLLGLSFTGFVHILLAFVATLGISAMSYELFEKRFIAMKDRYFAR
jgi:peptidoglycan/LPS O-acetylase OafA/YrhL